MYQSNRWPRNLDINEYWTGPELVDLRQALKTGKRDPGCVSCWQLEDRGQVSMRQSVNISRLGSVDFESPTITQVKLVTGKTCNLSCMMCFPTVSSTYHQLWGTDLPWAIPAARTQDLGYDRQMDQYIRENSHSLRYIEVLGGEPLFCKPFLDLAKDLVDTGASQHITLFVITNGTLLTPYMSDVFSKFKKTVFTVSIDGVGLVNDYQRWPSKWETVESNLRKMAGNFDVSVLPTVTAINITRLPDLYEYCDKNHLVINNVNLVGGWPQLLPGNLPDKLRSTVDTKFQKLLDSGGSNSQALVDFINRWDQQRGISIIDYLPEWQGLV